MDMLAGKGGLNLFGRSWRIYSRSTESPPHYVAVNSVVSHSLISEGCHVNGEIYNSVLFSDAVVKEGATVKYSILMPGAVVECGAVVEYAIVAENARVGAGSHIGQDPGEFTNHDDWGVAVVGPDVTVGEGKVMLAKEMLDRDML